MSKLIQSLDGPRHKSSSRILAFFSEDLFLLLALAILFFSMDSTFSIGSKARIKTADPAPGTMK
ncbi:unnamed protein product, partial [Nesidiocoris tenuis]